MENELGLMARFTGGVIALAGAAFGLGKYNSMIVKKKELYNDDGSLVYMPAKDADKCKEECQKMIAEVTSENNIKFDKIIGYVKEQNDRHITTTEFIGRVKQYMENNK